jgi:hypothetical protein
MSDLLKFICYLVTLFNKPTDSYKMIFHREWIFFQNKQSKSIIENFKTSPNHRLEYHSFNGAMKFNQRWLSADFCSNAVTFNATVFVTFSAFFDVIDSIFKYVFVTGIECDFWKYLLMYLVTF